MGVHWRESIGERPLFGSKSYCGVLATSMSGDSSYIVGCKVNTLTLFQEKIPSAHQRRDVTNSSINLGVCVLWSQTYSVKLEQEWAIAVIENKISSSIRIFPFNLSFNLATFCLTTRLTPQSCCSRTLSLIWHFIFLGFQFFLRSIHTLISQRNGIKGRLTKMRCLTNFFSRSQLVMMTIGSSTGHRRNDGENTIARLSGPLNGNKFWKEKIGLKLTTIQ